MPGYLLTFLKKNLSEILPECQTAWIQIRTNVMGPNCMLRFSEGKSLLVRKELWSVFVAFPGPQVLKFFHAQTPEHEIIILINDKMPTIVGILTFISMIITTSERLNARNFFICRYFSFY